MPFFDRGKSVITTKALVCLKKKTWDLPLLLLLELILDSTVLGKPLLEVVIALGVRT